MPAHTSLPGSNCGYMRATVTKIRTRITKYGDSFLTGRGPPNPGGPSIAVDGLGSSIQGWQGARAHPKARETSWTSHYGRGFHVGRDVLSMQLAGSTRRDGYGPAVSYGSGYGSPVSIRAHRVRYGLAVLNTGSRGTSKPFVMRGNMLGEFTPARRKASANNTRDVTGLSPPTTEENGWTGDGIKQPGKPGKSAGNGHTAGTCQRTHRRDVPTDTPPGHADGHTAGTCQRTHRRDVQTDTPPGHANGHTAGMHSRDTAVTHRREASIRTAYEVSNEAAYGVSNEAAYEMSYEVPRMPWAACNEIIGVTDSREADKDSAPNRVDTDHGSEQNDSRKEFSEWGCQGGRPDVSGKQAETVNTC